MASLDDLTPHRFHILVALADADRHGADIVRDVLDQTDDALRLWPATLYRNLEEMEDDGLIRELQGDDRPDGVSGRRRYYRITPAGRELARVEAARLAGIAGIARSRLERA